MSRLRYIAFGDLDLITIFSYKTITSQPGIQLDREQIIHLLQQRHKIVIS